MAKRSAKIVNKYGIHCRPAAVIAKEAQAYSGSIFVQNENGENCEARNIMGLIGLGITVGQTIHIEVDGPDAETTADRMAELFSTSFDFTR
jgi:phosphocarrier protein HPr